MKQIEGLKQAIESLKNGEILLSPTDTFYSLLCDARNAESVDRLLQLFPTQESEILLSNDRMINQCFKDIPGIAWDMIDLSDRPLTLVLEAAQYVAPSLIKEQQLAIRKVSHQPIMSLLERFGRPLASVTLSPADEPPLFEPSMLKDQHKALADSSFALEQHDKMSGHYAKKIFIAQNGEVKILRN
jgi:L-threonylcarbamoyladenylate synthase